MRARIYQPARNAMQSGMGKTHHWVLEMVPTEAQQLDPLMGWIGSADTDRQVKLRFHTRQEAEDYARENGIDFVTLQPKTRKPNIRPRGYGENFATDRRTPWTH
ncbi:ETC complex I subunit [Tropicimonas sp. IMCC34043]|uniref:ETC complex I subunit n=1 Tax=Tropicimonas sp. IMCC34043 TaxID=2248760 RepID=UPI000E221F60|nr:ETC complex I subunit [Tropicimonas sp. IMCC34043]